MHRNQPSWLCITYAYHLRSANHGLLQMTLKVWLLLQVAQRLVLKLSFMSRLSCTEGDKALLQLGPYWRNACLGNSSPCTEGWTLEHAWLLCISVLSLEGMNASHFSTTSAIIGDQINSTMSMQSVCYASTFCVLLEIWGSKIFSHKKCFETFVKVIISDNLEGLLICSHDTKSFIT